MKPSIYVAVDRCKGCLLCIAVCQAGVLDKSSAPNCLGYNVPVAKEPEKCVNCGMCEMICPEFAIWVEVENGVVPGA